MMATSELKIGKKTFDLKKPKEMKKFVNYIYRKAFLFPKKFPSTNQLILIFILLSCISICSGIAISIHLNNWLWFSRFGSVCVVVAVLFIFYDITDYYDKTLRAFERVRIFTKLIIENFFDKILNEQNLPQNQKMEIILLRQSLSEHIKNVDFSNSLIDIKQEEQLQKNKLRTCEAIILIIGTLIWGFGDLIGCFIKK